MNTRVKLITVIMLVLMAFASVTPMTANAEDTDPTYDTGRITSIETFANQFVSGGQSVKNDDGGTDIVWVPGSSVSGHRFTFRVNFSTSGIGSVKGAELDDDGNVKEGSYGTIQIRIPKSILKDKDGNSADEIEMSVPEGSQLSQVSPDARSETHYAYTIDGDDIVFYNVDEVTAGQNGYFEVSYITTKQTYDYLDYDGKTDSSYDDASNPFTATITADGLTKTGNEIPVYINTQATLRSTSKEPASMYRSWDTSWGTTPSDASDYYYVTWPIYTYMNQVTQRYDLTLTDTPQSITLRTSTGKSSTIEAGENFEVIGYNMGTGYKLTSDLQTVSNLTWYGYRYDYVLTRLKKSELATLDGDEVTSWTVDNKVDVTLHPVDGVDEDTKAQSSRKFSWTQPVWGEPTGHFILNKYGNENWSGRFGYNWDYASYDLDQLQNGNVNSLDNLKYYVQGTGYPFPWTQDTSTITADSTPAEKADSYGQNPVKYVLTDDTFYLIDSDNTAFLDGDDSGQTPLTSDDYDIQYVSVSFPMMDVTRDDEGHPTINEDTLNFNYITHTYTAEDVVTIETKSGDTWTTAGTLDLSTGKFTADASNVGVKDVTADGNSWGYTGRYRINMNDGVDGYRLSLENAYYYTQIQAYPYASLKHTDNVLSVTGTGDTAKELSVLINKATMDVYQQDITTDDGWSETPIVTLNSLIGDRLRRTIRNSSLEKETIAHANNVYSRRYEITWRVKQAETYTTGTGNDVKTAYVQQQSGVFYDLLPAGANLKRNSITVNDGSKDIDKSDYTYEIVQDWKGSGRAMLIVRVNVPGSHYTVHYTTTHSWDSLKDYGKTVKNPVAYETGNTTITNGKPDDGDGLSSDNKPYYVNVDEDTDAKKFLYDESVDDISAITSTTSGLKKQVISDRDNDWSYDTTVSTNGTYRYRLRFANNYLSKAKNLVFYDSLENYQPEGKTTQWHGTLQSIDTSQLTEMGVAPIVYLSATENLDVATNKDLSNTSVWLTQDEFVSQHGSIGSAKAIAIDMRKKADGTDFQLDEGQSVTAVLFMKAPAESPDDVTSGYPETYNNIYINDMTIDAFNNEVQFFIHQDYTTVRYAVTGDIQLDKVSSQDTSRHISGITFRLYGTSDYGDEIDETASSSQNGIVLFEDVPKGTYTLQETETTNDWLPDHTTRTVIIDGSGKVTIDGTAVTTSSPYQVTNDPRIHGDVSFDKVDSIHTSQTLEGATYRLTGTSDYSTEVAKYATSDENGHVTFTNIEKGTYKMKEASAPDGYQLDQTEYTVTIDESGQATIKYNGLIKSRGTVTLVSHTPNVTDDGTQTSSYSNNANYYGENYVKTIPGATSLHVKLTWGGEAVNYDYVCVWEGSHPTYTASGNGTSGIKFNTSNSSYPYRGGGGSHTASSNTVEFDVTGDTVTFAFRSDGSGAGDGYGYYAVITGEGDVYTPGITEPNRTESYSYYLTDEPYHYFTFTKHSTYDQSTIEGATFHLTGTSDNGTAVDMSATSDDGGTVRFDRLEAGTYAMTETSAPDDYDASTSTYVVTVNRDGTYAITGAQGSAGSCRIYDNRKRNKKITVTKIWDDGLTEAQRNAQYMNQLAITIQTAVTQASLRTYTITYDANGGNFGSDQTTNVMTFNAKNEPTSGTYATPQREGQSFVGWATSNTATSSNFTATPANFSSTSNTNMNSIGNGENKTLYAVWKDLSIRYAVSAYGIGIDIDDSGNTMGITFGPSLGAMFTQYRNNSSTSYSNVNVPYMRAHSVNDTTYLVNDSSMDDASGTATGTAFKTTVTTEQVKADIDAVQAESEPAITNPTTDTRNIITGDDAGTTDNGNSYRCLHYDNWNTIIYWNRKDPHVYDKCVTNRCSKTVKVTPNADTIANGIFSNSISDGRRGMNGDGQSYITTHEWDIGYNAHNDYNYNLMVAGQGYSGSQVRAALVGADELTNTGDHYAGADALTKYPTDGSASIISCFPQNLQDAIGKKDLVASPNGDTTKNSQTAKDKLWLFSYNDFFGNTKPYPDAGLGTGTNYSTARSSAGWFWLRSPRDSNSAGGVDGYGYWGGGSVAYVCRLSPGFTLAP